MPPTSHAPAKTAAAKAMSPGLIVLLLSLLLGLQPVTTDLYLPALPALTEGFGASMAQAQLTLTALLLSFGLSQLVWGPLSDRFGRRPVLLWGMVAYVAIGIFNIPVFARITRGAANAVWARDYITAARAAGKGPLAITWDHVLPNIASQLIVQATISFATAILAEAALSYLVFR